MTDEDKENERTIFLQRVLLDYLAVNSGEVDQAMMNARHFYIGQWYRDANALGKTVYNFSYYHSGFRNDRQAY